jgi:hypothetical protein
MQHHGYARNILGPEDLRLASDVFEAALGEVGESDLHPYTIRKNLAQTVMQQVFAGERDPHRLHDQALDNLRRLEGMQARKGTPIISSASNENVHELFAAKA